MAITDQYLAPPPSPLELHAAIPRTLFVFDFDGTLVETEARPTDVGVTARIVHDLEVAAQKFHVMVCSGRGIFDLLRLTKDCPSLDLIGSHGAQWWLSREKKVRELTGPEWESWRLQAIPVLDSAVMLRGGELEDKRASLTLHYKNSGAEWWTKQEDWLRNLCEGPADLLSGLECWNLIPKGFSKGNALSQYMDQGEFEQLIYFGDELTDETVFSNPSLKTKLFGVKVGQGPTRATRRLPDVKAVQNWLANLAAS